MRVREKHDASVAAHRREASATLYDSGIPRRSFLIASIAGVAGFALSRVLPPMPTRATLTASTQGSHRDACGSEIFFLRRAGCCA